MSKQSNYWRGRFSMLENSAFNQSEQAIQEIEKMYQEAQMSIQKELEAVWAFRFQQRDQSGRCPENADHRPTERISLERESVYSGRETGGG